MGVWGTGIMDSDLAQDIRLLFDDLVDDRLSVEEAVRRIREQYRSSLDDPDEYPVAILALAKLSLVRGEISEELKREAIGIIEDGRSLERWEGSPNCEDRRRVEGNLLHDLERGPVGPAVKRAARQTRLKIGDVVEIPLSDGRKAYGQYVFHDKKNGALLQVFDAITNLSLPVEEVIASGPMFPPIFTPISGWVQDGIWAVVGHSPLKDFRFPKFRGGLENREGRITCWWIYDGEKSYKIGKLPPEYQNLEYHVIWPVKEVIERIETGHCKLAEHLDRLSLVD